ncbi:MAG: SDR family NAD(P)-dependent oxidoreductase [Bradyrhizobium sp.]|nr:SDR family NAD(P)-dependent oxidoreductase [Bradyrhizobium sp.]
MTSDRTALVLGATGGIGGEVARLLVARGWKVRALHRDPERLSAPRKRSGLIWERGDAMIASDVADAADNACVIIHAVNPPGYRNWGKLVLPMLDNAIAAAHASRARIVLPGTIYNYGPDAFPDLHETSPQNPITVKGRIRAEMERRLHTAAMAGTRVLVVRAGDFFGPRAGNNWFSQGLVKPGKPVTVITYPGRSGVGHQWAYLPDVAETMVLLLERSAMLDNFAVFQMEGQWDDNGTRMIEAIRRAVGNPNIKVRKIPWRLMQVLMPFAPSFRELVEMRYLWNVPIRMHNKRLKSVLAAEPHTPLDIAVRDTLIGLGCLAGEQRNRASR